jgi:histone H3/H4
MFIIATIQKIITEILGDKSGLTFAKDARDLFIDCSVEFITLISSEANEISEREAKKTIAADHIDKALRELGFPEYVPEVLAVAGEHKEQLRVSRCLTASGDDADGRQTREKKTSKMEQSGLTEEELLRQQQELFKSATDKYNSGPA